MKGPHITREALAAVLCGTATADVEARLQRHLADRCPACGAVIDETIEDRWVPAMASWTADVEATVPTELERARARRRVVGSTAVKRRSRPSWGIRGLALAATLVLTVGAWWGLEIAEPDDSTAAAGPWRIKGPSAAGRESDDEGAQPIEAVPVALFFLVGSDVAPHPADMERGASGRTYLTDRHLVFRIQSWRSLHLQLLHVGDDDAEVIWPGSAEARSLPPGVRYLQHDGAMLAYSLEDLHGRHDFVLLGSQHALTDEQARAWVRRIVDEEALDGPGRGWIGTQPAVAYHRIYVEVGAP